VKIAVTAKGETLAAAVDQRFGRAARFIVYNTETQEIEAVDNGQNLQAAQGAGIQAAETVSRLGVECVLTGHCGPKAFHALSAAGIRIYNGANGTVGEAIASFTEGKLPLAAEADVEGHW
jgi:predicted Fe-Mo cluster-binding NifX family protein